MSSFIHRLDDLMRLQRNELHRGIVVKRKAIQGFVAREANDGACHAGISDRRAVAEEVTVEEKVPSEIGDGGCGGFGLHVFEMLVQVIVDVRVVGFSNAKGLLEGGMGLKDVLEKLARGALPAFSHPVVWNQHVAVWTPDAGDEDGFWGHGDVAGGSAGNGGEASEGLGFVVAGHVCAELVAAELDFGSDSTDPACVGVDDTTAYGYAWNETKLACSFF